MRHLTHALAALTILTLTACGDATTDEPLPEGQQPGDGSRPEAEEAGSNMEGQDTPDPVAEQAGSDADRQSIAGMSYVVPEGWRDDPTKRSSMRDLTLVAPGGYELAVKLWTRIGSFQGNIQRWTQMQLAMSAEQVVAAREGFEQIKVGGVDATWIPLTNASNNKAILAVWVPVPSNPAGPEATWTFKLTCPADQVETLAPAMRQWARSIRFE